MTIAFKKTTTVTISTVNGCLEPKITSKDGGDNSAMNNQVNIPEGPFAQSLKYQKLKKQIGCGHLKIMNKYR